MIKLSVNETKWSSFASQDPRSYSLYFDLNIWFRVRKVTGTFEKRAPGLLWDFSGLLEFEARPLKKQYTDLIWKVEISGFFLFLFPCPLQNSESQDQRIRFWFYMPLQFIAKKSFTFWLTTTTTSLFQIEYSLQSLCPQLAKAIRGGYKRKRKLYKYIYIYIYIC